MLLGDLTMFGRSVSQGEDGIARTGLDDVWIVNDVKTVRTTMRVSVFGPQGTFDACFHGTSVRYVCSDPLLACFHANYLETAHPCFKFHVRIWC